MHPLLERIVAQLFGGAPRHPESETLLRALDAGLSAHDADAQALRAGDEHFRVLAETIPAAIFIYQGERFRYVNAAASELTGYTREELLSVRFWDVVHPEHRELVRARGMARQRGESLPQRYSVKLLRKDGTERWVVLTAGRIEFQGEQAGLGTAFDITDRKNAEDALARQGLAFDNLYDAVLITDPRGRITDWNPAAERIYGWNRDEVLGRTVDLWLPRGEAADLNRRILDALDTEGRWSGKIRFVRKDGGLGLSETVVVPLRDAGGRRVGALGVSRDVTQSEQAAEALRASEERYRLMVAGSEQVFFYQHDLNGVYESVSPSVHEVLGYHTEEMVGRRYGSLQPAGWDIAEVDAQTSVTLGSAGAPHSYRVVVRHRDGHPVTLELVETAVRRGGEVVGVQGFARDITARTRAEEALRESEERYRTLFEESRDAVYITTLEGRFVAVNQALVDQFGYTRQELLSGDVSHLYADPQDRDRFRDEIFREGFVREFEVRFTRRDGETLHCLVSATLRRAPDGTVLGYQGIIHDITERKRAEERLAYGALHDALTGLPNRALFMDRLERAAAGKREGAALAVFFMDLDRFKVINDSLGHGVGDRMLVEIARRLAAAIPADATVARFGGDEFTLLLPSTTTRQATHMAERLLEALAVPFALAPGHDVFASASMGIALASGTAERPEELLRNADAALSRAKARGKNRYEVFDRAMHAAAVERLRLESDLRRALERGELRLLFQPMVSLEDGRVAGFEGLLRWDHPERGTIAPNLFIPLAEETGLISAVGRWVLEEGCSQLAEWTRRYPDRRLIVSLNLSARQFGDADLADHVARGLVACDVDPSRLWLEITETVILENAEPARSTLRTLKELGVQLCMDDFGTGYSSLGYLHRMELDELKIDRSFVSRMDHDRRSTQLVHAIIALAHNLGVRVVAEGVETPAQLASLRTQRCDYAQGFLFARPLTPAAAADLLDRDTRW
ncbi:MAG TPA: PAS domain S-box protein [Longimicrobium sp.]